MSSKEQLKDWDQKIIRAYSKVLKSIPQIASGLFSLVFVGYILGWIRARSYFSSFGAGWILSDLSLSHLLSLSIWPVLAILISLIITMTDIAERLVGENLRKAILFLIGGFIIMHFGSIILEYYQEYETSVLLAYVKVYYSASILMIIFGEKILQLRQNDYKWTSQKIWELSLWTFLFILSCSSLGSSEGQRDSNIKVSQLPKVVNNSSEKSQNWKLLYSNDDKLYITELKSEHSKVRIINASKVLYIQ